MPEGVKREFLELENNEESFMSHKIGEPNSDFSKKSTEISQNDKSNESNKKPKTFPLNPPTLLDSKINEFLPKIAEGNKRLATKEPTSVNIEHVEDGTENVIEWVYKHRIGVFEHKESEGIVMGKGGGNDTTLKKDSIVMLDSQPTT
ncbi:11039_t:CDS:2, partial [Acaulospora colombiana]